MNYKYHCPFTLNSKVSHNLMLPSRHTIFSTKNAEQSLRETSNGNTRAGLKIDKIQLC